MRFSKNSIVLIVFIILLIIGFLVTSYAPSSFKIIGYVLLNPVYWTIIVGPTILSNQDSSINRNFQEFDINDLKIALNDKIKKYQSKKRKLNRARNRIGCKELDESKKCIENKKNIMEMFWKFIYKDIYQINLSFEKYRLEIKKIKKEISVYEKKYGSVEIKSNLLNVTNKKNKVKKTRVLSQIAEFREVISTNRVTNAWNDINNQLQVAVLSLIFTFIVAIKEFVDLLMLSEFTFPETVGIVLTNKFTAITYFTLVILTIYILFFELLSRKLFSIIEIFKYIEFYKKVTDFGFPPISRLTYVRMYILSYSILFTVWKFVEFDCLITHLKKPF